MTKTKIKPPSNIDKANYDYLTSKPEKERNLVDIMFIKKLEEKCPGLKT